MYGVIRKKVIKWKLVCTIIYQKVLNSIFALKMYHFTLICLILINSYQKLSIRQFLEVPAVDGSGCMR